MTAEQYAAEYRRYAAFVKNYSVMGKIDWWKAPPITRIAGGENATRPEWTETLMKTVPHMLLGGVSVHCYVKPGEQSSGTDFSDESWYQTARNTLAAEALFEKHINIMDYYDPDRNVILAVDEWGIWVDNEPDSIPAFLFQQNTMRSALCAALMLHIFHKHAERIRLANLAQTINVLQAIMLTDDEKMLKTPTYHVFDLFQRHQDARWLPLTWADEPSTIEPGLPRLDVSASIAGDAKVTTTMINLSASESAELSLEFVGRSVASVSGRVMDGDVTAHNTFEHPDSVSIREMPVLATANGEVAAKLPPCGIASIEVTLK
jgi:alpha-N-arabinofuranosidase